jgi:hypothetical protein
MRNEHAMSDQYNVEIAITVVNFSIKREESKEDTCRRQSSCSLEVL